MELGDSCWIPRAIACRNTFCNAHVARFESARACSLAWEELKLKAIAQGGALVYHVTGSALKKIEDSAGISYIASSQPEFQLWHFTQIPFPELLMCVTVFGFPGTQPEEALSKSEEFLLEFHAQKPLALTQVEETHILVDLADPTHRLSKENAHRVLEFNKEVFHVQERPAEERDKVRNWLERNFFTIGLI